MRAITKQKLFSEPEIFILFFCIFFNNTPKINKVLGVDILNIIFNHNFHYTVINLITYGVLVNDKNVHLKKKYYLSYFLNLFLILWWTVVGHHNTAILQYLFNNKNKNFPCSCKQFLKLSL